MKQVVIFQIIQRVVEKANVFGKGTLYNVQQSSSDLPIHHIAKDAHYSTFKRAKSLWTRIGEKICSLIREQSNALSTHLEVSFAPKYLIFPFFLFSLSLSFLSRSHRQIEVYAPSSNGMGETCLQLFAPCEMKIFAAGEARRCLTFFFLSRQVLLEIKYM